MVIINTHGYPSSYQHKTVTYRQYQIKTKCTHTRAHARKHACAHVHTQTHERTPPPLPHTHSDVDRCTTCHNTVSRHLPCRPVDAVPEDCGVGRNTVSRHLPCRAVETVPEGCAVGRSTVSRHLPCRAVDTVPEDCGVNKNKVTQCHDTYPVALLTRYQRTVV